MNLSTARYLAPEFVEPAPAVVAGRGEFGWTEVSKGLLNVLSGYILSILNGVAGVCLLWMCTRGFRVPTLKLTGDDLTLFLIGGAVLFFSSLYSTYLLLRGKWRCMMSAPERRSARWFMFASMICVCAGPAINFASGLIGVPAAQTRSVALESHPSPAKAAAMYVENLRDKNLSAYMRLTGDVIAPFGPIFFVLFLRAVHACLGSFVGARLTELYLLFVGLLAAGTASLLLDSTVHVRPDLLFALAGGWLLALVWYFLLIVGAVFTITRHVNTAQGSISVL